MLILFDFDGTLVDSRRCILTAMGRAFATAGRAAPEDAEILATVGLQPPAMLARLAPGLDAATREAIAQAYRAHSIALRATRPELEPPFAGARACLAALKAAGHRLGVVTGKSAQGLAQCLDHLDWNGVFDSLQPADGAPGKPDPTLILRAIAAMQRVSCRDRDDRRHQLRHDHGPARRRHRHWRRLGLSRGG